MTLVTNAYDAFNPGDIQHSISFLCSSKACGIDAIFAEHLLHASPEIHAGLILSICFNAFIEEFNFLGLTVDVTNY